MFAEVFDPRNKKGKRHPLKSILGLLIVGLMCGHKGYTSIATWARTQTQLAKALGLMLTIFTAWTWVNREQVALDAGYAVTKTEYKNAYSADG